MDPQVDFRTSLQLYQVCAEAVTSFPCHLLCQLFAVDPVLLVIKPHGTVLCASQTVSFLSADLLFSFCQKGGDCKARRSPSASSYQRNLRHLNLLCILIITPMYQ